MIRCLLLLAATTPLVSFAESTPIDPYATAETRALFHNLIRVAPESLLFGHQETVEYGIGWRGDPDRSDVKSVTGSFPAVYGWDFFDLSAQRDSEKAEGLKTRIEAAYNRGGVITFSWHMWNPVTGENFYDTTPAVAAILPGGEKHEAYKKDLDDIAAFVTGLHGEDGEAVPIIFRPFHEHTGSWFWWGQDHCTKDEFIALWRFTVEYLRDGKGVHNLLYAYSPSYAYDGKDRYWERYPGDEYVDVLGIDGYLKNIGPMLPSLRRVVEEAERRGKVPALTEAGYPKGLSEAPFDTWYTEAFLEPLKADPVARRVAYMLVWRNAHEDHFWAPYPGHPAVPDFIAFYNDPFTVFEDNLPEMYKIDR